MFVITVDCLHAVENILIVKKFEIFELKDNVEHNVESLLFDQPYPRCLIPKRIRNIDNWIRNNMQVIGAWFLSEIARGKTTKEIISEFSNDCEKNESSAKEWVETRFGRLRLWGLCFEFLYAHECHLTILNVLF